MVDFNLLEMKVTSVWILLSDSSNKADLGINVSSGLNIGFTHISLTSLIPLLYIFFLFKWDTESFIIKIYHL